MTPCNLLEATHKQRIAPLPSSMRPPASRAPKELHTAGELRTITDRSDSSNGPRPSSLYRVHPYGYPRTETPVSHATRSSRPEVQHVLSWRRRISSNAPTQD